jgi:hypothetical protein
LRPLPPWTSYFRTARLQSDNRSVIVSGNIRRIEMKRCRTAASSRALSSAALAAFVAAKAFATVTLNLSAAYLNEASGTPMPTNGLVLLVASTSDSTFGTPTFASFVSGDDTIVAKWDLSTWSTPGLLLESTGPVALGSGWNAGDPLQLYWFPTLTLASASPGVGASYGKYRTNSTVDGGDPWTTPADGATIALKFLTADAGGSNPNAAGNASLVVEGGFTAPVILSLTIATTNAVITWSAVSNHTYRLQYRSELDATWTNLAPDVTATNGTASAADGFGGQTQRFYRVQLVQ